MITQSSAANTESPSSIKDQRMALGTDGKVLATSPTPPPQKPVANITCFHCAELTQGMDEHGRPRLHCLLLSGPVSPKTCGREYAGCAE